MTHQEFLDRVKDNLKVDVNYYTKWIEPLYMMCDLDKDQFCASFNKWGKFMIDEPNETVFEGFVRFYLSYEQYEKNVKIKQQKDFAEIARLQNVLIVNGLEKETGLQTKELIIRKIELGRELTKAQLEYIYNNL